MRHGKAGSVMTTEVVRALDGTPFKEVARLLVDHRIGGRPVAERLTYRLDDSHVRPDEPAMHV